MYKLTIMPVHTVHVTVYDSSVKKEKPWNILEQSISGKYHCHTFKCEICWKRKKHTLFLRNENKGHFNFLI